MLGFLLAIPLALLLLLSFSFLQPVYAENVIFVIPGSSDPRVPDFDPSLQIITKDQSTVFVNPDGVDHHLVVKDSSNREVFDSGVLKQNQFVTHTFSENGEYTLECKIYPDMKGQIRVTDDIATFTQTIDEYNIDVQLSRSPASPGVGVETYFKVIFIDKETGRNRNHVDYTLAFNDSSDNYVDGMGGHTVDGAEYGVFKFDTEDAFTPTVTVSGLDFVPIRPVAAEFNSVVTPEFPPILMAIAAASGMGAIIALYRTKFKQQHL